MNKLELKHLAPYLPYGLRVICGGIERNLTAISLDSSFVFVTVYKGSREKQMRSIEDIKPILYPLSDLVKPCLPEGKIPFTRWYPNYPNFSFYEEIAADFILRIKNDKEHLTLDDWNWLFEHHFDVHNLIEQNLAIDINTIEK
jgi:hypothetical protein